MQPKGETTVRRFAWQQQPTGRILITEHESGEWWATVMYMNNGTLDGARMSAETVEDAYVAATKWLLANLDQNANIEPL